MEQRSFSLQPGLKNWSDIARIHHIDCHVEEDGNVVTIFSSDTHIANYHFFQQEANFIFFKRVLVHCILLFYFYIGYYAYRQYGLHFTDLNREFLLNLVAKSAITSWCLWLFALILENTRILLREYKLRWLFCVIASAFISIVLHSIFFDVRSLCLDYELGIFINYK